MAVQVIKIDREGWAMFAGGCGELHLGTLRKVEGEYHIEDIWSSCVDTPDNRAKTISAWKANSFSREVKA
jgi:hypothetical protein